MVVCVVAACRKQCLVVSSMALFFIATTAIQSHAATDVVTQAPAPASKPAVAAAVELSALELYEDQAGGFSLRLPPGFSKLNSAENKALHDNLSQHFGKEIGERTLRQPPVYFRGPADPTKPKLLPPSLVISCTGAPSLFDAKDKDKYRQDLEKGYRKRNLQHGDINIEMITLAGQPAVRAEHALFSPVDNSRAHVVMMMVSGPDRRYDIVFNFSPEQKESIDAALDIVSRSFAITTPTAPGSDGSKWGRIALWTIGGFVVGILLSVIMRMLTNVGSKDK